METQITKLILENDKILRLGLCFEFADARIRITKKLEDNLDECKKDNSSLLVFIIALIVDVAIKRLSVHSKTCVKRPLKNRQSKGPNDNW